MIRIAMLCSVLTVFSVAHADCNVRSASVLDSDHVVGAVTDLREIITPGRCSVQFRINVNSQWHQVQHTELGDRWTKESALCKDAVKYGREQLLASVPGKFKTQAITVCVEGSKSPRRAADVWQPKKLRIGDSVLENEAGTHAIAKYFEHQNQRCRLFQEHISYQGTVQNYNGVICQNDTASNSWTVIDRW